MKTYARVLFTVAAAFNFAIAGAALFARPALLAMLELDPVTGTNVVFVTITAVMIACFGYSYACIAYDAQKYRAYISLGIIGKLLVVGTVCWLWLAGTLSPRLPSLAAGDLIFAALFADYLRRSQNVHR
ncbi:MAG: hypothetical protein ACLQAT_11290 [Candidatus Binataceae bacterium]